MHVLAGSTEQAKPDTFGDPGNPSSAKRSTGRLSTASGPPPERWWTEPRRKKNTESSSQVAAAVLHARLIIRCAALAAHSPVANDCARCARSLPQAADPPGHTAQPPGEVPRVAAQSSWPPRAHRRPRAAARLAAMIPQTAMDLEGAAGFRRTKDEHSKEPALVVQRNTCCKYLSCIFLVLLAAGLFVWQSDAALRRIAPMLAAKRARARAAATEQR